MAKRMFIAVEIPTDTRESLAAMNPNIVGLRWLPADQLHLTLCFLPSVPEENEVRLIESLAGIEVPRLALSLQEFRTFVRRGIPSVVCAGVVENGPDLRRLQQSVRSAVIASGLEVERKGFHPHVTVGRCKDVSPKELAAFLLEQKEHPLPTFEMVGLTLYESVLRPGGAEHKPVVRCSAK